MVTDYEKVASILYMDITLVVDACRAKPHGAEKLLIKLGERAERVLSDSDYMDRRYASVHSILEFIEQIDT